MTYTLLHVFVAALAASTATLLIERWFHRRRVAVEVSAALDAAALFLEQDDDPQDVAVSLRAGAHQILAERFGEDMAVMIRRGVVMEEGRNDGT